MSLLPAYTTRELIQERLPLIFPEGTVNRNYIIRDMAASSVFTFLYIGAVEGYDQYLGPMHIYRMTSEQEALTSEADRLLYGKKPIAAGNRWYADNTREPIRDETLREGLVRIGAVKSKAGLPTTSSKPRYYLKADFAALFDPHVTGELLEAAIAKWQKQNLSKGAQTRISLAGLGKQAGTGAVLVSFPNGETRSLTAGPSSVISKEVIESFAPRFLKEPAVLWLSTSDSKVVTRDEHLAASIGLSIQADRDLPDIILVDLGPNDPLLVFVEVVATDGPISERRQEALYALTDQGGFHREQVRFVTAYFDRGAEGYKKTYHNLAWNSFAWFVSEPDRIIWMQEASENPSLGD